MDKKIQENILSVPIWENSIKITRIDGGITNQNFLITDSNKKYFVRVGEDIPEHLVSRSNELNSNIDFEHSNYTDENLLKFEESYKKIL